jgi:hypothetical protein
MHGCPTYETWFDLHSTLQIREFILGFRAWASIITLMDLSHYIKRNTLKTCSSTSTWLRAILSSLWSNGDEFNFTRDDKPFSDDISYNNLVGCILWTVVCTRPYIAATVSCLCRFVSKLQLCHLTAAKGVLRYLKGTSNRGLTIWHHPLVIRLSAFVDSTWGSDPFSI